VNLREGALHQTMLAHELGDTVRDADQRDRRADDTIRQRLDRVREEDATAPVR
jgi:hypothetical protein